MLSVLESQRQEKECATRKQTRKRKVKEEKLRELHLPCPDPVTIGEEELQELFDWGMGEAHFEGQAGALLDSVCSNWDGLSLLIKGGGQMSWHEVQQELYMGQTVVWSDEENDRVVSFTLPTFRDGFKRLVNHAASISTTRAEYDFYVRNWKASPAHAAWDVFYAMIPSFDVSMHTVQHCMDARRVLSLVSEQDKNVSLLEAGLFMDLVKDQKMAMPAHTLLEPVQPVKPVQPQKLVQHPSLVPQYKDADGKGNFAYAWLWDHLSKPKSEVRVQGISISSRNGKSTYRYVILTVMLWEAFKDLVKGRDFSADPLSAHWACSLVSFKTSMVDRAVYLFLEKQEAEEPTQAEE